MTERAMAGMALWGLIATLLIIDYLVQSYARKKSRINYHRADRRH